MNKFANKTWWQNIAIASGIAIFFIADRLLKILALRLNSRPPFKLVGDILTFNFTSNYYMAFSLPLGGELLNIAVTIVIFILLTYIIYLARNKPQRKIEIVLLIIITSGALSNIFDRLIYGYVIDYLALKYFTIFNLADVMISGGALALIAGNLKNK